MDDALQRDAATTGILLHTRLLNCPYQLGPPLQKQLFGELQAALDEPFSKVGALLFRTFFRMTGVLVKCYQPYRYLRLCPSMQESKALYGSITQLLLLDRVYQEPAEGQLVYVYPETEYYHKHCQWSWTWGVPGKAVPKGELERRRVVMLLSTQAAAAARCGVLSTCMV